MVNQVSAPVELTVKHDRAMIRNKKMMKMVKKKILPVMRRRKQRKCLPYGKIQVQKYAFVPRSSTTSAATDSGGANASTHHQEATFPP
jgi:hypothetical protein